MPSFDIACEANMVEVRNAVDQCNKEIANRFDFKGSQCKIDREEAVLTIHADDQTKLRQMHELLKAHMVRRKVDPAALEFKDEERASGNTIRQVVIVKQGIAQDVAKRLVGAIKEAKLKVQSSIQGDELRVSGKSRDELQRAIALLRGTKVDQPLQYVNFRD